MTTVSTPTAYASLGLEAIVNAAGNFTVLGGSVPSDNVLQAMMDASRHFVPITELQDAVHTRLAEATGNEAAYVAPGASAGLYLATLAAVSHRHGRMVEEISRDDLARARVLVHRGCRTPYDAAVAQAGAQLVECRDLMELEDRVTDDVVAVLHIPAGWNVPGTPSFEAVREVARHRAVPMLVDAAAQIPPKNNLWRFTHAGADVALFSGGKGLRGPQSSGLMLGQGPVMEWVRRLGYPRHGYGRALKVGREQLAGLLTAVEEVLARDEYAQRAWCEEQVQRLLGAFADDDRVLMCRRFPNIAGQPLPYVEVTPGDGDTDLAAVAAALGNDAPRVVVAAIPEGGNPDVDGYDAGFIVNTLALREGDMDVIVERLRVVLDQAVGRFTA